VAWHAWLAEPIPGALCRISYRPVCPGQESLKVWSWLVSAHAAANNGPVSECSAPSTPVRRAAICPACTAGAWRKRTHSARAVRDAELKTQISRVHADSFFGVDGARKVWRQPPAPTGGWS